MNLTRREFLKGAAFLTELAAGASVFACEPETPELRQARINTQFAFDLLKLMKYNPSFQTNELYAWAHERTYKDKKWVQKEVKLGEYIDDYYQTVGLALRSDGEVYLIIPNTRRPKNVVYPDKQQRALITTSTEKLDKPLDIERLLAEGKKVNILMVYGSTDILQVFDTNRPLIAPFLDGYSLLSKATVNVLHVDLNSGDTQYADIGGFGIPPFIPREASAHTSSVRRQVEPGSISPFVRLDVILKIPRIHFDSRVAGLRKKTDLRIVLADERLNSLAYFASETPITDRADESFSALGSFAAGFDQGFANRIIGPTYAPFTLLLENIMEAIDPDGNVPKKFAHELTRRNLLLVRWLIEAPVVKVPSNIIYQANPGLTEWVKPTTQDLVHQYVYA